MKQPRTKWDHVRWTPFEEADAPDGSPDKSMAMWFLNSIYQVEVRGVTAPSPFGKVIWLSIKTRDKQPRHDWRELQRIKNELVGEEVEAVEIYPAESRLVDTSNQYHLWCFPYLETENGKLPFGYSERLVAEGSSAGIAETGKGYRQRDFRDEFKPIDLVQSSKLDGLGLTAREKVGGRCPLDWSPLVERSPGVYACLKQQHYWKADNGG